MNPSNLLEYVIPILFLIIFVISKVLGKKSADEVDDISRQESLSFDIKDDREILWVKTQNRSEASPAAIANVPELKWNKVSQQKSQLIKTKTAHDGRDGQREILKRSKKIKGAEFQAKKGIHSCSRIESKGHQRRANINRAVFQNPYNGRQGLIAYEIFAAPVAIRNNC